MILLQRFLLILFMSLTACVSVKFAGEERQKFLGAKFVEPKSPFEDSTNKTVDRAWINKNNGNTISYFSDCFNSNDPSLENIQKGILSEIENAQDIEKHEIDYNGRKALHSTIDGSVDGIPTRVELILFKKNNCTFILTYAAVQSAYGKNQKEFKKFVKDFVIP